MLSESNDPSSLQHIATEILIVNYLHVFAIVITVYDHLITSGDEVEHIWGKPKTTSAYWFFLVRYYGLVNKIISALFYIRIPLKRCKLYLVLFELMSSFTHVFVCYLLSMQVIALYLGSRYVKIIIITVVSVTAPVTFWLSFTRERIGPPANFFTHCIFGMSREGGFRSLAPWQGLSVFNSMVFGLTLAKTLRTRRETRIPLISIILKDGILYYAFISLSIIANSLTFYLGGPYLRGGLSSFATRHVLVARLTAPELLQLLSSIVTTMMARLMLNLLQVSADSATTFDRNTSGQDISLSEDVNPVELDTVWTNGYLLDIDVQSIRNACPASPSAHPSIHIFVSK